MRNERSTIQPKSAKDRKTAAREQASTENCKQIWIFDSVDRDGDFRFTVDHIGNKCKDVLDKVIHYSALTWAEIKKETHGSKGKSKHHFLTRGGLDRLSEEARERIERLKLEEDVDNIFSMRFDGKTRVIGLRKDQHFVVKWFDPEHKFYPVD
jgi:hypothetical protein